MLHDATSGNHDARNSWMFVNFSYTFLPSMSSVRSRTDAIRKTEALHAKAAARINDARLFPRKFRPRTRPRMRIRPRWNMLGTFGNSLTVLNCN